MGCPNCARQIYVERRTREFTYQESITSKGGENRLNYRARNRRVVIAFSEHPLASLSWTEDEVIFNAPAGVEAVVEFVIGT